MDELLYSIHKLKDGLEHHDRFGPITNEAAVYLSAPRSSTFYELPYEGGRLHLSDLRNILELCKQHGLILERSDANS